MVVSVRAASRRDGVAGGELRLAAAAQHLKRASWDFPGCPVVKTLHFHCRGRVVNPWLGN